ncbi:immunoglobulin domain-containing protein [Actomonas aquatica]|uniref:Immunoglobulin domain-containing protein n=1 Tax=Actomonas aquatica TaxID=2866162 RepID=A0ABZ1CCK0_9BACT|nr:immunoglobulin domain-containing protein [Opitutus sp. WL0086]WRQ89161.1 immunoglobulin domain-containing protein [Opitutus sp. WL0086]
MKRIPAPLWPALAYCLGFLAAPTFAQSDENPTEPVLPPGVVEHASYTLKLGAFPANSNIRRPATFLAPGTAVTLRLSSEFGEVTNIRWYRNNTLLTNTSELVIPAFDSPDSGYYRATFSGHAEYSSTNTVLLLAGIADRHRLINQSTRVTISPSSPRATFGFVINPPLAGSYGDLRILIRVIGPALAGFGVASPLSDPVYRLYSSAGDDVTPGMVFLDYVGAHQDYRDRVNTTSTAVGAFPVDSDIQSTVPPRNLADVVQLSAGAYTLTVSSASGATGEVLVEIYDTWTDPAENPTDQ